MKQDKTSDNLRNLGAGCFLLGALAMIGALLYSVIFGKNWLVSDASMGLVYLAFCCWAVSELRIAFGTR